jgi:hypothetical protein
MKKLLLLLLLLPFLANAQINGTLQKTSATDEVRGAFGSIGIDTLSQIFKNAKTAYVDTLGNNTTAKIGRTDKPYATITAAIDALGSSGIIQIGVGRFASPDSSKIKSNYWFKGSGKPVPNWTINVNRTKTAPTRLINGTVLYGVFDASREKNISVSDLGIDVGSSWATTFNAGVAKDALLFAATDFMVSKPPLPGIVVKNVSTLGKDATSSFHAALFENLYYPIVNNLSTYYLAAGIVIKTTGGTYTDLQAFGHTTAGLYIKANDAIVCRDLVISNVTVSDINNYDNGGILFTAEANIFNVQLTNFSVRNVTGVGLRLFDNGAVIDNALIANGTIDSVKYAGGSTLGHGVLGTFNYSNLSNIVIRDVQGSAFNMTGILNSSLSNLKATVSGGYNFILSADASSPTKVSNIYSYTVLPTGLGISWSGTGIYGTDIFNSGTTSGTPLTALNAATSVITDNTTSNTTVYPAWTIGASYNSLASISSTKLSFNPSTGILSATGFSGGLTGNASTATSSATLTTTRTIFGQNFNGSANVSGAVTATTIDGTIATFNSSTPSKFWDGSQGLFIGPYTGGGGFGAIYSTGVTPGATNYMLIGRGDVVGINATGTASLNVAGNAIVTANSTGLTIAPTPTTSASTYDILTRNTSTGVVEKVASSTSSSGTYTPTLTNITNAPTISGAQHFYTRVGNIVTVYGRVTISPTAFAGTSTQIEISLPVASNFTTVEDLIGIISSNLIGGSNYSNVTFNSDSTNDRAQIDFSASASSISIQYSFNYIVK